MEHTKQVAFIGFGEAARAFVSGWGGAHSAGMAAFDIKTQADVSRVDMLAQYRAHGVTGAEDARGALHGAGLVFSLVTADQALAAAQAAAPHLDGGVLWLDCNSCAPETKVKAAKIIESAGGRYVDVAIMAPVHPKRHLVPMLVSGPHATPAMHALHALSMRPQVAGEQVGQASSIKMLRSVMIKGLEALSAECFLAARRAGVEEQVLASLEGSDPDINWRARASYNLERMVVHGARRASEMQEVAATVAALGLPCAMSAASAQWQAYLSAPAVDPGSDELIARMDRILAAL
ncbi:MAG: NAD(P)-dependent oxidoreductase [Rhodobacteraceae bacterium]|nr:NAD(P)-dependent oxidoreductase [Paracoccaceae bacterium]